MASLTHYSPTPNASGPARYRVSLCGLETCVPPVDGYACASSNLQHVDCPACLAMARSTRSIRCPHGFERSVVPCVECESAARGVAVPAFEPSVHTSDERMHKRPYLCGLCGQHGHSRATCPTRPKPHTKTEPRDT
jgi:hypothetical protein